MEKNQIYYQKNDDSACSVLALFNIIEIRTGIKTPYEEALKMAEPYRDKDTGTMNYFKLSKNLGPFAKFGIKKIDCIYNERLKKYKREDMKPIICSAIDNTRPKKRDGLLFSIKMAKEGRKIQLDHNHFWKDPGEFDVKFQHQVCFQEKDVQSGIVLENSWGPKFGIEGMFRVKWKDLPRLVTHIWRVYF